MATKSPLQSREIKASDSSTQLVEGRNTKANEHRCDCSTTGTAAGSSNTHTRGRHRYSQTHFQASFEQTTHSTAAPGKNQGNTTTTTSTKKATLRNENRKKEA